MSGVLMRGHTGGGRRRRRDGSTETEAEAEGRSRKPWEARRPQRLKEAGRPSPGASGGRRALSTPWFWTSGLQNPEAITSWCLSLRLWSFVLAVAPGRHTAVVKSEKVLTGRRTCPCMPSASSALGWPPNLQSAPWTQVSSASGPETPAPIQLPGSSAGDTALGWLEGRPVSPLPLSLCEWLSRELMGVGRLSQWGLALLWPSGCLRARGALTPPH